MSLAFSPTTPEDFERARNMPQKQVNAMIKKLRGKEADFYQSPEWQKVEKEQAIRSGVGNAFLREYQEYKDGDYILGYAPTDPVPPFNESLPGQMLFLVTLKNNQVADLREVHSESLLAFDSVKLVDKTYNAKTIWKNNIQYIINAGECSVTQSEGYKYWLVPR